MVRLDSWLGHKVFLVKTKVVVNNPDGTQGVGTLVWPTNHGALACQIVSSIISSDIMSNAIKDEPCSFSPKRIAIVACDLAEAMYSEMEERDWLLHIPDPNASHS